MQMMKKNLLTNLIIVRYKRTITKNNLTAKSLNVCYHHIAGKDKIRLKDIKILVYTASAMKTAEDRTKKIVWETFRKRVANTPNIK